MPRHAQWLLGSAAALVAAGIYILGVFNLRLVSGIFMRFSYYILLAMVCLWVWIVARQADRAGFSVKGFLSRYWVPLGSAALLTVLVCWQVPSEFRVVNDEPNLVSVSHSMFYKRWVHLPRETAYVDGQWVETSGVLPKRPLLFSFFLHFVHLVKGYAIENAFWLNRLVLFCLLLGSGLIARRVLSPHAAVATQLLILSQPIIVLSATSGGFELFSHLFFLLTAVSFYCFLREPSPANLTLFWIHAVLFSNTRYECVAYVAVFVAAMILTRRLSWSLVKPGLALYLTTPLFLFPLIWPRVHFNDLVGHAGAVVPFTVFSAKNTIDHTKTIVTKNVQTFVSPALSLEALPYNTTLNFLALVVVLSAVILLLARKFRFGEKTEKHFLVTLFACFVTYLIVFLSHNAGSYLRASGHRYFALLCLFSSFVPLVFLRRLNWSPRWSFMAFAAVNLAFHWQITVQNKRLRTLVHSRRVNFTLNFLKAFDPKRTLVVAPDAINYAAARFASAYCNNARNDKRWLWQQWASGNYDTIFVIDILDPATGKPLKDKALQADGIWLQPFHTQPNGPTETVKYYVVRGGSAPNAEPLG